MEDRLLLSGKTIYVDVNSPGPARDGTAWGSAFADLQLGLGAAAAGDTILVADGTYKPTSGTDRTFSFQLKTGVTLYGGYAGYGATNPDARDVVTCSSVLSGDIGTVGSNTDNSYHVVVSIGIDSTALLGGFTITGGNANGDSSRVYGGGMYNSGSSPTVINCAFGGNTALYGGGVANLNARPAFSNCTFIGNTTTGSSAYGGGMYNAISSNPKLTNCAFSGNTALRGGAVYNTSSSPTLANCIIWSSGNSPFYNDAVNPGAPVMTYSDIQGGYTGTGNINAEPLFVRSPWTGPDGVFSTADDDFGDLRLRAGSPALDIGSNAAVPTGVTTDLSGKPRIQNDTVDLGAYEGPATAPAPKTFYVDIAAVGDNTGVSWTNAFTGLQPALLVAVDGDTIRIADGTYKPTTTTDRMLGFALRNAVATFGGYAGYGATNPDARDVVTYPTLLSGDIGTVSNIADNSYHVLTASGMGSSTVLDGVTVTGGNASGTDFNQSYGGGLLASGSSLVLNNCAFTGSTATGTNGYGGGIYDTCSSPTLTACTFIGNTASGNNGGGGMYNRSSSPTLTNCMFSGNTAPSGGGMSNSSSSPALTNCTLSGNAASSGSGMYNAFSSNPTLTNCIIWGSTNSAMFNSSSAPVITYSDIQQTSGAYIGTGNINADPLFVRLPWTGSDGVFGTADDDYGDLRLRAGSPALDIGSNAAVPTGVATDLNGNARIKNDTVDLGAYEGPATAPAPKTLYVDVAAVGATTGVSWANAFTSLQPALSAAVDGDTIRIADGTYKPTSTTDRTIGFALRNAVAIFGGYAGYGAPNPDARDVGTYRTLLSGDIGTVNNASDNSYHVVTASGMGSSTALDGITVTGGNANGTGSDQSTGGGLIAIGGSPTLTNCTFSGSAASSGGGVYNSSCSPTLTNCTFSGNTAPSGGGVYNSGGSPTLTNCAFSGNAASSYGGGMYNSSSSPTLANCTFSGNAAGSSAGGMYNASSTPTLTNCIIWGSGTSPMYNSSASTPVVTYSDIQQTSGVYTGTGNINAEPLFVRSPWTGPDGVIGTPDDDYGDLRIRTGSPALDIGCNAAIPTGITTDLAGQARIQNGIVDMGAYEGPASPAPKILYVDVAAIGTKTGVSWTNAFTSLQPALSAAVDGDTIRIADGTYKPTSTTDRTIGFALRNAVAIFGGYAGYGAPNPDARDMVTHPTILSGDIGTVSYVGDNSYHVLTAVGISSSAVLDGVSVTGGDANGTDSNQSYGGGLLATNSSLTLNNCTFRGNTADGTNGWGGGVYNASSSPTLANCTFSGNTVNGIYGEGGGMYNSSSSPNVINCTFIGNTATGTNAYGGGMFSYFSSAKLTNCTLIGNTASLGGGGIFNSSASPTLTNCIVWGNRAPGNAQVGGSAVITYSDIQGGYTGTGNINADPLFVCSLWTGADGVFGTADDDCNLHLRAGSPSLDVGSNTAIPTGVTTDLSGDARIQNGTVDLGAYEGSVALPAPKTLYVDLTAVGAKTGTSWTNAFTSLQAALSAAVDGDTIRIADGTYKPTATTDRTMGFALRNAVAIYGGYAGYGAPNPDARDVLAYPTVLSGDIGTVSNIADNSYHVLTAIGMSSSAVLDGVSVTGGNANGSGSNQSYGGGLLATNSSPTLNNCTFGGNAAVGANGWGGGICNFSSSPTLTNCAIIGNMASGNYGYGGGIYNNSSSSPKLTNCTLIGNTASSYGGVMYSNSSSPTLTNCIIWGSANTKMFDSSTLAITYSDIQGGYSGTGNVNADPLFVRSPWTGPDGIFGTADDDYGDLRLRNGSPALDIGSNAAIPTGITTDMAGLARIQNGTVDLGALEGSISARAPRTLYVDLNATGSNTGASWTDAFRSLQSALVVAADGDTICIADGTYKPTSTADRTIGFALRNAVAIYGGYAGSGAINSGARDVVANPTILSGDIGVAGSKSDNCYHVVTANVVGTSTVLDGVTVTGGNANGSGSRQSVGGGLCAPVSSPTLIHCTFSGNSASNGGGIYSFLSNQTLTNCTISGNSASYGGGMYNDCSTATLTNCMLSGNTASSSGGGMYNYVWSPTLTNCTFDGNSASSGGGMYNDSYCSPTLTNCTLTSNTASSSGGGMYNLFSSNPVLTNCIVWGSGDSPIYNSSSTPLITYSDIQQASGKYSGAGNINSDPLFVRNPYAGADGKWGTADDDYGDLRPQLTSPVIDAGNNSAVPASATTDLAGKPRFLDMPGVPDTGLGTAPIVDMGAYERGLVLTTTAPSGSGQFSVGLTADHGTLQIWSGSSLLAGPTSTYAVNTVESCEFVGSGDDMLTVDVSNGLPGIGLTFTAGGGNDRLVLTGTTASSSLQVMPGQVLIGTAAVAHTNTEVVQLDGTAGGVVDVGSLTVAANLEMAQGKNLVLRTGMLSIVAGGTLDLAGNGMILKYSGTSPAGTVNQWIGNGRMGITPGLQTSGSVASGTAALGMVDNALVHLSSFAGQSLGGVFSQLLIQQTVAGDANLDGVVDDSDYHAVIANMGRTGGQWFLGDLNGDGVVSADDFAEVTAHLTNRVAGAPLAVAAGPVAPASGALRSSKAQVIKNPAKAAVKPKAKAAKPKQSRRVIGK